MPGDFRCDRGDYARMLILFCMRGCGCIERPAFPAPSEFQKAGRSWQTSRETRGEIARPCLNAAGCLKIESVAMHGARTRREPGVAAIVRDASRSLSSGAHSRDPLATLLRMRTPAECESGGGTVMFTLMVRSASLRVSNHEAEHAASLRDSSRSLSSGAHSRDPLASTSG